jgi:excisionase family DNA binding protein
MEHQMLFVFFLQKKEAHKSMDKSTAKTAYRTMFREYPDIVTVKEVCQMLGLGSKKVYRLIRSGEIQRIPCGRTIRIAKVAVIEYVLQSTQ